ncbi:hypothetical protein F5Y09DRAFT_314530 [Xylaria sp. FL1042]|nr:hypothetical protein F5Y09DRAFT_314530 [Xylaria sp. FL1042]
MRLLFFLISYKDMISLFKPRESKAYCSRCDRKFKRTRPRTPLAMASGLIDDEHATGMLHKLDIDIWNHDNTRPYERVGHLDTKADANLISSVLSDFLGHERMQYHGPNFSAVGNAHVVPKGQIDVFFSWKRSPTNKLHKETFLVFDNLPYDIILGNNFLQTHEAYVFNGKLLPLALKPASKGEKQNMEQNREAEKTQQEADEEAERAKGREERERQRQKQAQALQAKDQTVVLTK